MLRGKDRLIVALDVSDARRALELVEQLTPYVGMFKVGMELFYSQGSEIIREIKKQKGKIFLDLKLHDIPNTVARAAVVLARLGVDMINVHAAGGGEMMRAAVDAVRRECAGLGIRPPLMIAVTVLTSISQEAFNSEMGVPGEIMDRAAAWAGLARNAGMDGVVASPREVVAIRQACGPDFIIVTPGVRPAGSQKGDQKRIMTPGQAVKTGATYLVVGRPITGDADPARAAGAVVEEIEGAM